MSDLSGIQDLINIIKSGEPMPQEELQGHLKHLGITVKISEVEVDQIRSPNYPEHHDETSRTAWLEPDDRAAQIIAALHDKAIDIKDDVDITILTRGSGSVVKEPYWIIGVKPWGRQMAISDTRQASFVAEEPLTEEKWGELLSDKTSLNETQADHGLTNISKRNISTEKWRDKMIDACQNGIDQTKITAETILNSIYHHTATKRQIPGPHSPENTLRPLETFHEYQTKLNRGKIDDIEGKTNLKQLFLDDLANRAKQWRKETGTLPDENTDAVIDPEHPSLSQITWAEMSEMIKSNNRYGFRLSEEWQYRGISPITPPQSSRDLGRINAALTQLQEYGSLPQGSTKTNHPPDAKWATIKKQLLNNEDSSIPREFMKNGLKAIEDAHQTPITAKDIKETRDRFISLDEAVQEKLLDQFGVQTIDDFCNAILQDTPSISILHADHPVAQAQAASFEPD